MNLDRLKRNVGQWVQLLPSARRLDTQGGELESVDDDWILEAVGADSIGLSNPRTGHVATLGHDHIHNYTSNPQRSTQGVKYGFLTLNVQIFMQDRDLWILPNPKPGEPVRTPNRKPLRMDALSQAREVQIEATHQKARTNLFRSSAGITAVQANVVTLFNEIARICEQAKAKYDVNVIFGHDARKCVLTNGRISVLLAWQQPYANNLDDSRLTIAELNERIALPGERLMRIGDSPPILQQHHFNAEVLRDMSFGWIEFSAQSEPVTSLELADRSVQIYLGLLDRLNRGALPDWNIISALKSSNRSRRF
jgi:hypothetical protein